MRWWTRSERVRSVRDIAVGLGIAFGIAGAILPWFIAAGAIAGVVALAAGRRFEHLQAEATAPRRFTGEQRVALVDRLGAAPKGRIVVLNEAADAEAAALSDDLADALAAAGFNVFGPLVGLPTSLVGVVISVHRDDGQKLAEAVADVLSSAARIAVSVERDVPQAELFSVQIGRKP